jgi:hypothetical protein
VAGYTHWQAYEHFCAMLDGNLSWAAHADGKCVAVFILIKGEKGTAIALVCSNKYFEGGAKALRHAQEFMRDLVHDHGPIDTVSQCPQPDAKKWLKLIGFEPVAELDETTTHYRFSG